MRRRVAVLCVVLAAVVAGALAAAHGALGAYDRELATHRELRGSGFVGSRTCARCHGEHTRSWQRTFHRTMTQEATRDAVAAPFAGERYAYAGLTATMDRDDAGRFRITVRDARALLVGRGRVVRTVGSRRFQQYLLAGERGTLWRAPVAWSVEERRWIHMNGAFLTPDPDPGAPSRDAFMRHVTRWNDNCVFCHNTGPNPGYRRGADRFATRVAELGIACEACHGPGELHVRANTDPLRRYALHARDGRDPTIVNPARLSPERAADVCGRCHGQRTTDHVERFLARGDPFVPGEPLELYSAPLWQDTTLTRGVAGPGEQDGTEDLPFAERFWRDGTARLTAYEYQGVLQSPCRGLTCTTCHAMHEGDPHGQLRPAMAEASPPPAVGVALGNPRPRDSLCTGCHRALSGRAAASRHARHGEGVRCVDCHMPRIVYGLVDAHRSHRIQSPDPARDARHGRPDACTLCHAARTRAWAARERTRLWPDRQGASPGDGRDGPLEDHVPELVRALFGGDPIERTVAARALGEAYGPVPARLGALLVACEDEYPAVRRAAWRSARRLAGRWAGDARLWLGFDPTGSAERRARALHALRAALGRPEPPIDPASVASLRAEQREARIFIGE